jgi:hypothetical protein
VADADARSIDMAAVLAVTGSLSLIHDGPTILPLVLGEGRGEGIIGEIQTILLSGKLSATSITAHFTLSFPARPVLSENGCIPLP